MDETFTIVGVYSDDPPCDSFTPREFHDAIDEVVRRLNESRTLSVAVRSLHARLQTDAIPSEFDELLERGDYILVDTSHSVAGASFALGRARGSNTPGVVTASDRSVEQGISLPVDSTVGPDITYRDCGELPALLEPTLMDAAHKWINSILDKRALRAIWFEDRPEPLRVVCPPSYDDLESAVLESPNYIYLDNFGDKDAFLEIAIFLAKEYRVRVDPISSDKFSPKYGLRDNLLVIGGPGAAGVGGNRIARELMNRVNIQVEYDLDDPTITFADAAGRTVCRESEFDREGLLRKDYGCFARFPNPFHPARTCVLIQGIHTSGVLGAAQAFLDNATAFDNIRAIRAMRAADRAMQATRLIFEVEIFEGEPLVPRVEPEWIISL